MRPAGMPRGSGVSLSLDAPLGRRTNPPRPNTAVRNFAMDTVQANVLQPLLEDMFIAHVGGMDCLARMSVGQPTCSTCAPTIHDERDIP